MPLIHGSGAAGELATPIKVHDREITEATTKITWTAASDGIGVGQSLAYRKASAA